MTPSSYLVPAKHTILFAFIFTLRLTLSLNLWISSFDCYGLKRCTLTPSNIDPNSMLQASSQSMADMTAQWPSNA